MKLVLLLIILIMSPIFIQMSFATDSGMMGVNTLNCQGNYYNISYQISNATVTGIPTNSNDGLIISIQNSTNGIITVSFPRQYMDQRTDETDYRFIVLIDGETISDNDITDQSNSTDRILTVNLPDGNFKLEIPMSGTPESLAGHHKNCVVVPEFGSLTLMIIFIGILVVILIQKHLYLSSMKIV